MGTFLSDVYVKTADADAVRSASGATVTEAGPGWVKVSDPAHAQDEQWLTGLVQHLSGTLSTTAVAVLVHDSDVFRAWLAESGAISGTIDSWPGWPEGAPLPRNSGLDRWLAACATPPSLSDLRSWVTRQTTFAEEGWHQLAAALGIDGDMPDVLDADPMAALGDLGGMGEQLGQMFQDQLGHLSQGAESATSADTAFVEAAWQGDLQALRAALEAGQDPDAVGPWKPENARSGPMAAMMPSIAVTPLYVAALADRTDVIELLCEAGADPEKVLPHGDTPLAGAAAAGKARAVEALLDEGVDPEQRRPDGQTALTLLASARAQIAQLRSMVQGLPMQLPGMPTLPDEADLDACEALLREAIAD